MRFPRVFNVIQFNGVNRFKEAEVVDDDREQKWFVQIGWSVTSSYQLFSKRDTCAELGIPWMMYSL